MNDFKGSRQSTMGFVIPASH